MKHSAMMILAAIAALCLSLHAAAASVRIEIDVRRAAERAWTGVVPAPSASVCVRLAEGEPNAFGTELWVASRQVELTQMRLGDGRDRCGSVRAQPGDVILIRGPVRAPGAWMLTR